MLSGESIFTKKACIADAPVICFTPNARMASGVKVSNAEANFRVSISRHSASTQSGVLSSKVRVFDIVIVLQRGAGYAGAGRDRQFSAAPRNSRPSNMNITSVKAAWGATHLRRD